MLRAFAVGHPDQLAKRTFSYETPEITSGEVTWEDPPEIGLTKVQADGYLVVHRRERIASLTYPWPLAAAHAEVLVELKMAGDHLDEEAIERALLRRQARQVQRAAERSTVAGQTPLWIVAPHIPRIVVQARALTRLAAGCYLVEPSGFPFVWIAANELPLSLDLVPFLMARSGKALGEFIQWVAPQKPIPWVVDVIRYVRMNPAYADAIERSILMETDDPEIEARTKWIARLLLRRTPEVRNELIEQGIEQGLEQGIEQGIEQGHFEQLVRSFERRLARPLTRAEHEYLLRQWQDGQADQLTDLVLDLSRDALTQWLAARIVS